MTSYLPRTLALAVLGFLMMAPAQAQGEVVDDLTGDGVPDALEPAVCGLEDRSTPADGTCEGDDYTPPAGPGSGGLPDGLEAVVCGLEDRTTPADGACEGDDYTPPAGPDGDGDHVPDDGEWVVCSVEDRDTPEDGWCNAALTDYVTPTGEGEDPHGGAGRMGPPTV